MGKQRKRTRKKGAQKPAKIGRRRATTQAVISHESTSSQATSFDETMLRRAERQILSKERTKVLRNWLTDNGYSLPMRVYSHIFVPASGNVAAEPLIEQVGEDPVWLLFEDPGSVPIKIQQLPDGRWTSSCSCWSKARWVDCVHIKRIKNMLRPKGSKPYETARRYLLPRIIYPEGTPTEFTRRNTAYERQEARVQDFLESIFALFDEPAPRRRGNQPTSTAARACALIVKALLGGASYHRVRKYLHSDGLAFKLGLSDMKLHKNTLSRWAADPHVTLMFYQIWRMIVLTLRKVETVIIIDGTGRATTQTGDYFADKYGRPTSLRKRAEYIKEHVFVGRYSGIPVFAEWSLNHGRGSADAVHLQTGAEVVIGMLTLVRILIGDKAYGSAGNGAWCERHGIQLITRERSGEKRQGKKWPRSMAKMARFEKAHPKLFARIYRARNLVESFPRKSKSNQRHYRLRRRVTDPIVHLPPAIDDEELALTQLSPEELREIVELQQKAIGVARLNEGLAIFIRDALCALVVLEELHDQEVRFVPGFVFEPIPSLYIDPLVDIEKLAEEERKSA